MNKRGSFLFYLAIFSFIIVVVGFSTLTNTKQKVASQVVVGEDSLDFLEVQAAYYDVQLNEKIKNEIKINNILKDEDISEDVFRESLEREMKDYNIEVVNDDKLNIKLESKDEKDFSRNGIKYKKRIILEYEYSTLKKAKDIVF